MKRPRCPECGKPMKKYEYYYCTECDIAYNPSNPYAYYVRTKKGWKLRKVKRTSYLNPNNGLYKEFHGTLPTRIRKVSYEPPNPNQPLIKLGRMSQINYVPEFPSKRKGVEYYHKSGDTGYKTLRSNLILATDLKGKNLYLIREGKSKYPIVTGRGIIG